MEKSTNSTSKSSSGAEIESAQRIKELEEQIRKLQQENEQLKLEKSDSIGKDTEDKESIQNNSSNVEDLSTSSSSLSRHQIERYSRQLILKDGFGVEGQKKLLSSSVLIVGAGGIGSTVILYLAACGVGHITIVDFDKVEISNLHRQVIHKSQNVGMNKADSACRVVNGLNPSIDCQPLREPLTHTNALEVISRHDCVVDASDNPQTRYVINDACVLAGKPLISGSAIGTEGQLTVYHFKGGSCYRCLYPKPPKVSDGWKTCADNGVLGPVPGLIGILQALETVKVITGAGDTMHDKLVMYDSLRCSFMKIKKPPRQPSCPVCGSNATICSMDDSHSASQSAFGLSCPLNPANASSLYKPPPIPEKLNVSCSEFNQIRTEGSPHILLDVRMKEQFDLCSLEGAINIPWDSVKDELDRIEDLSDGTKPVYCICRRGILSVIAAKKLNEASAARNRIHSVKNIHGGLDAWRSDVDELFPKY